MSVPACFGEIGLRYLRIPIMSISVDVAARGSGRAGIVVGMRRPIGREALRVAFIALSFRPRANWLATWAYVRLMDRRGAFATAPFVAASIFTNSGLGMGGVALLLWTALPRRFDLLLAAGTVLAVSLFGYASMTRQMRIDRHGSAPRNENLTAFDVLGTRKWSRRLLWTALLALLLQGVSALAAPSVLMLEPDRREFIEAGIEVNYATPRRFATLAAAEEDFRARLGGSTAGIEKATHLAALDGYDFVALVGRQTTSSPRRTASALVAVDKHSGAAWTLLQVIADEGFAAARRGEYFVSPAGPLFRLPVRLDGTGALNRDLYFVWRDDRLIEIDTESWLRTFRLGPLGFPPGAGIWKGVAVDPVDFSTRVEVWLEGDANCCPSGGAVDVVLELRGRALVVKRAIRRPASGS